MDFDDVKENIQPLAAGRNATILQATLQADSHQELQLLRNQFEKTIQNYTGDDPLEPWYEYVLWIEQSFPSGGKESGLEEVLLKCLATFEKDKRYTQDRRMIKLYIKYIDTHENPQECYQKLFSQGIGTMVADLYICWAYYFDLVGNYRKADQVFRKGLECRAQPLEELQEAHQHFGFTMSQRILYNDECSNKKYQTSMLEKRQALTSLNTHKKKIGSIRTGAAVKSLIPGQISQKDSSVARHTDNRKVCVYEDETQMNAIPVSEPDSETSVVKAILDNARKQENVKEPGPWNKPQKIKGNVFSSRQPCELSFEILEDEASISNPRTHSSIKPFAYFDGFKDHNEPQEEWNLPVTLEQELVPKSYPSYDKCMLYPKSNLETSIEELGCYYWYKKKNIENDFTKMYDNLWKNNIGLGVRMYPNFSRKNKETAEEEPKVHNFSFSECIVKGKSNFAFDPMLYYPPGQEELQFEEIISHNWRSGKRKLKFGGNETIAMVEEMEETVCLPIDGPRRKSHFPNTKPITPSLPNQMITVNSKEQLKINQEELPQLPINPNPPPVSTGLFAVYEDDNEDNSSFSFKVPEVSQKQIDELVSKISDKDGCEFEGNETCSTQAFNCFIKTQCVSTPKAPNKDLKTLAAENQQKRINFDGIENVAEAVHQNYNPILVSSPEYNDVGLTLHAKQLSTIMETSEHATGATASTKSSISPPEVEGECPQSKTPPKRTISILETVKEADSPKRIDSESLLLTKSMHKQEHTATTLRQQNDFSRLEQQEDTVPIMPTIKTFEDQTETVPKILFRKNEQSQLEDTDFLTKYAQHKKAMALSPPTKQKIDIEASTDKIADFFLKTPTKHSDTLPAPKANKSIFTASAFMNFEDSPVLKMDGPKHVPYTDKKNDSKSFLGVHLNTQNSSFLPNVSKPFNELQTHSESFLTSNLRGAGNLTSKSQSILEPPKKITDPHSNDKSILGEFSKIASSNSFVFQGQQLKDNKFMASFQADKSTNNAVPEHKSMEDIFLSGFPSVAIQPSVPPQDTFFHPSIDSLTLQERNMSDAKQSFTQKGTETKPSQHSFKFGYQKHQLESNPNHSIQKKLIGKEPNTKKELSSSRNFTIVDDMDFNKTEKNFKETSCSKFSEKPSKLSDSNLECSVKPDMFYEDNIRTEAFATNLSMIMNSTWLPNHKKLQEQTKKKDTSEIIPSFPPASSSAGQSFFSTSSTKEKSTEQKFQPTTSFIALNESGIQNKPKLVSLGDCIEIQESDEECDNLGKSIYYTKTPKTPKLVNVWSSDDDDDNNFSIDNNFIHAQVDFDHTQQLINDICVASNVNPFSKKLKDAFLSQIDLISFIDNLPICQMVGKVMLLKKDSTIQIKDKVFSITKLIGEGAYGTVYCGKELESGKMFALKQERPANLWEFYICLELQSRLHSIEMFPGFMKIDYALIGNNASVLVSKYSRYGSLIAVCNKIKKETLKNVDEYVVMHLASQLLLIMDHLHASNIIHADLKADNFLLMDKLVLGKKQPTIQIIDFGNAIDMNLFPKRQTFTYVHETQQFKCIEMHEKRPWTFQLDLFGLAGVIHVLLFGKYMELVKKPTGWTHRTHIPRYFNKTLWETIFQSLLNVTDCTTMPNLQNLRALLEEEIAENDKCVCQKIVEFNRALDM